MKCPKCQYENREGVKFCEGCGTEIPHVCHRCGSGVGSQARFCGECGAKLTERPSGEEIGDQSIGGGDLRLEDMQEQLQSRIPQPLAEKLFAGAKKIQGEYRFVTAIFADVVGSSKMARNVPMDQYVEAMDGCFKMMVDIISIEYEGSINRFIGDCVLAFFGAPIIHENDPERAILAALDICSGVKKLNLDVSIGINTGMTYVGEMGSDLVYSERSAWGPDVDFAKRLQDAAKPGEICVGTSTYGLAKRAFDFKEPAHIQVKNIQEPQAVYPVLNVREHPEKLRGIAGLDTQMIGRESELAALKEAADNLTFGIGGIVSIIGEVGLGKSRLASELKEYLEDEEVSWYEGRSISIGQIVDYCPFIGILRTCLDLKDSDSKTELARKLKESVMDLFPQRWKDVLPFLGYVLSIKSDDELDDRLAHFTPEQVKHQALVCLRDVFTTISRRKPLLLALEDLNWCDDLSLDLVSLLMDELAENPLMLLCVYRPEQKDRCSQIGAVASRKCPEKYTEINLKKLPAIESYELVESLLKMENIPKSARHAVLEKSEGNPFFIEEIIRSLINKGLVYHEDGAWKATEEIVDLDVPDAIQGVLLSRVDVLEPETKYILQNASVIGRLFRYRLLDHLIQHDGNLKAHLSQLEERDLIYKERTVPEVEYAFKHPLTREATYHGIPERRRKEVHQRVADSIEVLYKERLADFYVELAHHQKLAGNDEKAIEYLLKSGTKAARQFAGRDALRYFDQAKELLEKSAEPSRQENAAVYEKRGEVLQWIGRWTEALNEYKDALQWCDDPHDRAGIYQKIGWLESEEMQDKAKALEHLEQGLKELPENDTSVQRVRLEHNIAWVEGTGLHLYEEGLRRCQQVVKIAEEMEYRKDIAVLYAYIENFQSHLGDYSDEYGHKAIDVAEELGDPETLAWIYYIAANTRQHVRNGKHWIEQGIPYYLRSMEFSERIGATQIQAMTSAWLGIAHRKLVQNRKAVENWERALEIAAGTKTVFPLLQASGLMGIYGGRDQADMVVSTFARIMRAVASLEIDEESQARAFFMGNGEDINMVYWAFRDGYHILMKDPEFPKVAEETLKDLLGNVHSRPQRAWYHTELMNIHLEQGDEHSAESHAKEAVAIVDEMGRPNCMTRFYPPYLLLNETQAANELAYGFLSRDLVASDLDSLLSELGSVYRGFDQTEAFQNLYERVKRERGEELSDVGTPS